MKSKKEKIPSESQEQQRLALKLRWLYPDLIFFAIPNGGLRNKGEASRMKLEGVEAGIPDIFISKAIKPHHGLYIELKRRVKKLSNTSDEQIVKHDALRNEGYKVVVCYGADQAITEINEYISI